ncbi:unnamed protein product [Rotaria sordida]|uniref:F-box domain-containing protein n=1 Tax=Rotaria sordida TaxID=392033 RepID=A0A819Y1C1_9BILA|nr:unnamed protein product [Rotaria sordida]
MDFELLPNEILLDLFDYFDGIDLLRAFYSLNYRFNDLLYNQFRLYRFNFSSISKRDFDMICQQHLPFITQRVISLSLTGNYDIPEQANFFLSYIPPFNHFIHLQLLSVEGFRSCRTLMKILDEYHHLCNLTYLTINSYNCGANQAHTVFQIPTNISSSLESASIPSHGPELNQLHTLIEYTPCLNRLHERTDKLLKSFQTSFWTNQHQCITSVQNYRLFDQPTSSYIRLPNIKGLRIKLPLNDQFWSIVPSLNILETLVVYSHADSFQSQLQVLLDRAPNLRCLDIRQGESLSLEMSLFQYRTSSVRQLDFRGYNYYFNEEECIRLYHSQLCIQREVLFIRIKSRHSTIYLVKNMINLRSLHVKRDDEEYHKRLATAKNNNDKYRDGNVENEEELIDWLKDCLPSTCLFSKNAHFPSDIVIWI